MVAGSRRKYLAYGVTVTLSMLAGCSQDSRSKASEKNSTDDGGGAGDTPADIWPTFGGTVARTGQQPGATGPEEPLSSVAWTFEFDGAGEPSGIVAVDTDHVLVSSASGSSPGSRSSSLYALDVDTGRLLWSKTFDTDSSGVTIRGEHAYLVVDGDLFAINIERGTVVWTASLPSSAMLLVTPTVTDETAYVATPDAIVALATADRSERWRGEFGETVARPLALDDETVYVGGGYFSAETGTIAAFDRATGAEQWRFETTGGASKGGATVAGDRAFVSSPEFGVYALDAETGDVDWTYEVDGSEAAGAGGSPAVSEDTVYCAQDLGGVFALDRETGSRKWLHRYGDIESGQPTIGAAGIYVNGYHDHGNGIAVLDPASGELEATFESDSTRSITTPVSVAQGTVFAADEGGVVYALR
jgi:outer membrane protein assembly factor BamB